MSPSDSGSQDRPDITARLVELEKELRSLEESTPIHSMKPEMLQRMEDLEETIEALRRQLSRSDDCC